MQDDSPAVDGRNIANLEENKPAVRACVDGEFRRVKRFGRDTSEAMGVLGAHPAATWANDFYDS